MLKYLGFLCSFDEIIYVFIYLFIRVVGSIIIVIGLYGFLWGQKMETSTNDDIEVVVNKEKNQSTKIDLELQLPQNPSFNGHPSAARTEL